MVECGIEQGYKIYFDLSNRALSDVARGLFFPTWNPEFNTMSPTVRLRTFTCQNLIWQISLSDPRPVVCIEHFTTFDASSSEANTRSIVVLQLPLCHVFVPLSSRLSRACSFMRLIVGPASHHLPHETSAPPCNWSCRLKSPTSIASTPTCCLLPRLAGVGCGWCLEVLSVGR